MDTQTSKPTTTTPTAREDWNDATAEERTAALVALGLTIEATFVPLSQSRNAKPREDGEVWRSLNWEVTLRQHGRKALKTDYAQGEAHCPAYTCDLFTFYSGRPDQTLRHNAIAKECETGTRIIARAGSTYLIDTKKPIAPPTLLEVCYSLALDASMADESFEDWCGNLGYDTDSRKAKKTYKACQKIAFKLERDLVEKIGRITEGY
jgi:hypothetical protein